MILTALLIGFALGIIASGITKRKKSPPEINKRNMEKELRRKIKQEMSQYKDIDEYIEKLR